VMWCRANASRRPVSTSCRAACRRPSRSARSCAATTSPGRRRSRARSCVRRGSRRAAGQRGRGGHAECAGRSAPPGGDLGQLVTAPAPDELPTVGSSRWRGLRTRRDVGRTGARAWRQRSRGHRQGPRRRGRSRLRARRPGSGRRGAFAITTVGAIRRSPAARPPARRAPGTAAPRRRSAGRSSRARPAGTPCRGDVVDEVGQRLGYRGCASGRRTAPRCRRRCGRRSSPRRTDASVIRYTLAPPLDSRSPPPRARRPAREPGSRHDNGQVGLDEEVVDQLGQRHLERRRRRRHAVQHRPPVPRQPARSGHTEDIGLGQHGLGERRWAFARRGASQASRARTSSRSAGAEPPGQVR